MVKGVVWNRFEYISRLKKEVAEDPEAKYVDLALNAIEKAQELKEAVDSTPGIYRERKLELMKAVIEKYEEAVNLLIKAILVGESAEMALRKLERMLSARATLRTKIIAALYGEEEPVGPSELAEKFGISTQAVHEALQELLKLNVVEKDEKGRYSLRSGVMDEVFRLIWSAVTELKARGVL
ncbi:MAG: winged helix-turn-helix transcriptional regulator [Thermococcus sp.]|uniref:winged helix-turn-helix domain-containing protein n=1 Tax=Thermococcus sp. TaxID=35749 RepID=UPI001D374340|nr:winged helix-turn-helix domain-containing protein [Thermococcus sp.]MBO8175746.1 winged helix-turn-helix transcriptional regulator [Thermococcus sp.]